ncbi:MAG: hypothetical protein ACOYNI_02320 [Acidimicrobiia bacterium]
MSEPPSVTLLTWSGALGSAMAFARSNGALAARAAQYIANTGEDPERGPAPPWRVPDRLLHRIALPGLAEDLPGALGEWLDTANALRLHPRVDIAAEHAAPIAASLDTNTRRYRMALAQNQRRAEKLRELLEEQDPALVRAARRIGLSVTRDQADDRVQLRAAELYLATRAEAEPFAPPSFDEIRADARMMHSLAGSSQFHRWAYEYSDSVAAITTALEQRAAVAPLQAAIDAHNIAWDALARANEKHLERIAASVELPASPEFLWDVQALIGPPNQTWEHDPDAGNRWDRAARFLYALQYSGVVANLRDHIEPNFAGAERVQQFVTGAMSIAAPFRRPASGPATELSLQLQELALTSLQGASRSKFQPGPELL